MIFKKLFKFFNPQNPIRIIFFSETKDTNLIGTTISFFNKKYIVEDVIRISWVKKRGANSYIPLYAVRGKLINEKTDGKGQV